MFTIITFCFDSSIRLIEDVSSELLALKTAGDLISNSSPKDNLARVCIYSQDQLEPIHTMRSLWPHK